MSTRDVGGLAAATVIVGLAALWVAGSSRIVAHRWVVQLAAGLVCGALVAVAVAAPFVDVVPDAEESPRTAGLLLVAATVAAAIVVGSRLRRRRGQIPKS